MSAQIPAKPGAGKGRSGTINGEGERGDGHSIIKRSKRKNDKGREEEVPHMEEDVSDGESFLEGLEAGKTSNKIKFERKARDTNQGDYPTKPDPNAKQILHFNAKRTGILDKEKKNTLGYIAKELWNENTVFEKGAKRERFYSNCIKLLKTYYKYQDGYTTEEGDSICRKHLHRNFKSALNKIKTRRDTKMSALKDAGYNDNEIPWDLCKPHYFSSEVWLSLLKYWNLADTKKRSKNAKEARKKLQCHSRTGATSYDVRREKIDKEREAKGLPPLTHLEFVDYVYNPEEPAVKELKEKMIEVESSMPPLPEDGEKVSTEIKQKRDLLVLLKAKPPRKGKLSLFPGQSVSELVGRAEAAQYAEKPRESVNEVSDHIYGMMSVILGNLQLMVHAMPTREITQAFLDQELSKLATAAFPNQVQELYRTHYIRAARGLIPKILIDNDKVIIKSSQLEPAGKEKEPSQLEPAGKEKEPSQPEPKGKGKEISMAEVIGVEEGEFDVDAFLYPLP